MAHDFLQPRPPITEGSIITVRSADAQHLPGYIGIVLRSTTWEPGTRQISIPGIGKVETALDRCYNATEAERKEYFKAVLKHGT